MIFYAHFRMSTKSNCFIGFDYSHPIEWFITSYYDGKPRMVSWKSEEQWSTYFSSKVDSIVKRLVYQGILFVLFMLFVSLYQSCTSNSQCVFWVGHADLPCGLGRQFCCHGREYYDTWKDWWRCCLTVHIRCSTSLVLFKAVCCRVIFMFSQTHWL